MEEVMEGISFLLHDFDQICRLAHATYRAYPANALVDHDTRAAAACMYCHMASHADRLLPQRPKVEPVDPKKLGGLRVWRVGDLAVLRFKKHDEDGKSRNYPTKQAKDYDRGLLLPGLPPAATRLSVGYLLDETGTVFVRTQVARPLSNTVDWCAAIVPADERRPGVRIWTDVTRQGKL